MLKNQVDFGREDVSQSSESSNFDSATTSTNAWQAGNKRDELKEARKIAAKEDRDVRRWREVVTGVLVIMATLVSVATYIFLTQEQVDDFKYAVSVS